MNPYQTYIDQAVGALRAQLNQTAGAFRQQLAAQQQRTDQALHDLAKIAGMMTTMRSGSRVARAGLAGEANPISPVGATALLLSPETRSGIVRIEDIPGRRVPYVEVVEITIGADTTSDQTGSFVVSQDGPFVAVKMVAGFLSQFAATFTDPETAAQTRITGRSFGRWRPIHSAADIVDSQHASVGDSSGWFLGLAEEQVAGVALPTAVFTPPATSSSFRTMEFDGFIEIVNAGSSYPRQSRPMPTAWMSPHITAPQELGALDFFERGEVVTIRVQPTHPNNPSFGNAGGACAFPGAIGGGTTPPYFPFVAGQFDQHEGICTPSDPLVVGGAGSPPPLIVTPATTDPITRAPDGIFYFGYIGYRIVQPAGPPF